MGQFDWLLGVLTLLTKRHHPHTFRGKDYVQKNFNILVNSPGFLPHCTTTLKLLKLSTAVQRLCKQADREC